MSLTAGRGPLSADPAGRFAPPVAAGTMFVEPFLRRVRAHVGAHKILDSERVVLVHRPGHSPAYAFPADDVLDDVPTSVEPAVPGYVRVAWDAATTWYEEEEQVFAHPRNPYHRVDCVRARRRLKVEVSGVVLVDTDEVIGVYETSRSPQLYVRRDAVRMDLLVVSPTVTYCTYKGKATHWTARVDGADVPDVAWSYDDPLPECGPIAGLLSFYPERATMLQNVLTWFTIAAREAPGREAPGDKGPDSHA
jgi:uncharacterized protein (DUF427 family)